MTRIIALALALLAFAVQPALAGFLVNSYVFATSGAAAATISFLQCSTDTGNLTTYTFTATNVGTASSDRVTFIGVVLEDSASAYTVSTVTVGGASATSIVDQGGTNVSNTAIFALANPSGTSKDIVVTASEAVTMAGICVWSSTGVQSLTPVATANNNDASAQSMSVSINTQTDGVAMGICTSSQDSQTHTWTGLTERSDQFSGENSFSSADLTVSSGSTPLSVTCDPTGSAASSAVAASFR